MTAIDASLGAVDQAKVDEMLERVRTAIRFGKDQRRLAIAIDIPDVEALVWLAERVDGSAMHPSAAGAPSAKPCATYGVVGEPFGLDHLVRGRETTTVCGRTVGARWLLARGIYTVESFADATKACADCVASATINEAASQ